MLKQKHHDTALASDRHLGTPEAIGSAILNRINETRAVWHSITSTAEYLPIIADNIRLWYAN
ncbi:hypothetical protein [Pseudoalteromonas sp. HM-SA03]|uniref:hypothetical protein n=1 Tax=Pseudoalteromonas sp. HM-SA03 TaxID=2029678 RepID=UPI0020D09A91|nr:hypothetical protein [Pseudoalteromonas sp. HM-SA03]